MNEELNIKFNLTVADIALSEIWDEPSSSKKENLRTGLIYLLLVGMMVYKRTPWQQQAILIVLMLGFSFLFSKLMRWVVARWGFRRDILKTDEVLTSVELIFSGKGVSYRSEKHNGSFNWDALERVVNTPCGVVVQLNQVNNNLFWIPQQVTPMSNRPLILEMLRNRTKVYLEPQTPRDPEFRREFERYQMNGGAQVPRG